MSSQQERNKGEMPVAEVVRLIDHVSKGDVTTVPAKTPHWFKEVPTKTIAYYAVNIGNQ